ncbi:hypothetical protein P389DRAFT_95761 [Cystobasidium minutum MCA 4210]|uniref:uncharacterized protein n=1 Tax=Cystobasidium minutum MCA 4210 TaxID=1397322 RepID=UPI0034CE323E|eukprot:jgi/Rhomi1/95761/CE95760_115
MHVRICCVQAWHSPGKLSAVRSRGISLHQGMKALQDIRAKVKASGKGKGKSLGDEDVTAAESSSTRAGYPQDTYQYTHDYVERIVKGRVTNFRDKRAEIDEGRSGWNQNAQLQRGPTVKSEHPAILSGNDASSSDHMPSARSSIRGSSRSRQRSPDRQPGDARERSQDRLLARQQGNRQYDNTRLPGPPTQHTTTEPESRGRKPGVAQANPEQENDDRREAPWKRLQKERVGYQVPPSLRR